MTSPTITENSKLRRTSLSAIDVLHTAPNNDRALLYFHGFPGPFVPLSEGETRMVDHVFTRIENKFDFYYPLYTLKRGKPFKFFSSIDDANETLEFLLFQKRYESVSMIVQSWGAVVGLPLIEKFRFAQVLLLTPFLILPEGKAGDQFVQTYSEIYPDLLPLASQNQLRAEFQQLACDHQPMKYINKLSCLSTVFASENDEIIPLPLIQKLCAPKMRVVVLDGQSHLIEDKAKIGDLIYQTLNRKEEV